MKKPFPKPVGVGANQPSPYGNIHHPLFLLACLFTIIFLGLQSYAQSGNKEQTVFAQAYSFAANDPEKIKVTPKFQLAGDLANIQILLNGDVNNNWMDLDMTLVNDVTGEKHVLTQGVEYYFGSDSDGPWTEGSRVKDVIIPAVEGGTYYLTFQPALANGVTIQNFSLTLNRDVLQWSNFWFAMTFLWLFPCVVWYLKNRYEVNRWLNSQ